MPLRSGKASLAWASAFVAKPGAVASAPPVHGVDAVPASAARRGAPSSGARTSTLGTAGGQVGVFGGSRGKFQRFFAPHPTPSFFGAGVVAPPMSLKFETPTFPEGC